MLPGLRRARCWDLCQKEIGHAWACACALHIQVPDAEPVQPELVGETFGELLKFLSRHGLTRLALPLRGVGISSPRALALATQSQLTEAGFSAADLAALGRAAPPQSSSSSVVTPAIADALVPLRPDHPRVRAPRRASQEAGAEVTLTEVSRAKALTDLEEAAYAASSRVTQDAQWRTWEYFARCWGVPPLPLTVDTVKKVLASFRAGHYRAVAGYVARARQMHIMHTGADPSPNVQLALSVYTRAVTRGMGPAALKDAFELEKLRNLVACPAPAAQLAVDPKALVVLGSWFMTRGIELSAARCVHLTVTQDQLSVNWMLPVSKTDVQALGTSRSLRCSCAPTGRDGICPAHVAIDYLELLRGRFTEDVCKDPAFPLFPNGSGQVLSQSATVESIRTCLAAAEVPLRRPGVDGTMRDRFSQHALRVSGAQFLARCGLPLFSIQLLGRWSSAAVRRYVQDAPLEVLPDTVVKVLASPQIADIAHPLMRGSAGDISIESLLTTVKTQALDIQRSFDEIRLLSSKLDASAVPTLVLNPSSKCVHTIAYDDVAGPSELWSTFRGWHFAASRFQRVREIPPGGTQCGRPDPPHR